MKQFLLLPILAFTPFAFGQMQLENPGFEDAWEDVPGSEDEPAQWSSLKTADALAVLAPIVVFQSDDAHSGSYCVKLENTESFDVVANGIMTNGRVHADLDPENGNVFTDEGEADWNTPFTDRPDSLVAWVKYAPSGSDRGKIEVLLHKSGTTGKLPETGSTDHWVGKARIDIEGSMEDWTRVSAPFNYFNEDAPAYALAVVTSGDSTIAVDGSIMYVDDIELIYAEDASVQKEALDFKVYTDDASNLIVNSTAYSDANLTVLSLEGKTVYETILTGETTQHRIEARGVLIYQIQKEDQLFTGKIRLD